MPADIAAEAIAQAAIAHRSGLLKD